MFGLRKKLIISLALGAGGARGLAHVGVLRALKDAHFPLNIITGSSAGALVGAMYAQSGNVDEVESKIRDLLATDFIKKYRLDLFVPPQDREQEKILDRVGYFVRQQFVLARSFTKMSFFNSEIVDEALSFLLDDTDIEKTKIPFGAVAVDYLSGEKILITQGSIRKAVAASCSIPGIFPSVSLDDKLLIDGGIISQVPVVEAREMGANFVIGVSVSPSIKEDLNVRNGLELMFRANEITRYHLNQKNIQMADVVIHPVVNKIHWADFKNIDKLINMGRETAERLLPEINLKFKRSKFRFWSS
ncbi:MAG: patatin-like phospholipase family protein [Candidatus Aminicenantales bacterium]